MARSESKSSVDTSVSGADTSQNEKISPNLKRGIDCYVVVHGTNLAKSEYVVYQDLYGSQEDSAPSRMDNPLPESGMRCHGCDALWAGLTNFGQDQYTRWATSKST